MSSTQLNFSLDVEDGWPPVATECLPCERVVSGFHALSVPLFVKDLSVDDIIEPDLSDDGLVSSWRHVSRPDLTTIWLARLSRKHQMHGVLARLRELGCETVCADALGCCAVDVPKAISTDAVDQLLATLDPNSVAVAFPSFRHPE
jgi:Domain of unknown function (DUF4265)